MDQVEAFKKALRGGYAWNQHQIRKLQEEIEVREHELTGLSRHGRELTEEQLRSGKPMPKYQPGSGPSLVAKICELDELKKQLAWQLEQYKELDLLDPADKQMCLDLYHFEICPYEVADRYGYSVSGMYKRIDSELRKVL